jgi:potassium efflux system protein
MRYRNAIRVVLLAALLIPGVEPVKAQPKAEQSPVATHELPATVPDLAEIIPQASNLQTRLAQLENNLKALPELSVIEKKYTELSERAAGFAAQLEEIKASETFNSTKLVNLKRLLWDEKAFFEIVDRPLKRQIRRVAEWKTEWLEEKNRWGSWEATLITEREPDQLKASFTKANSTIDTALNIVLQQLETMLRIQAKGGAAKARIDALEAETLAMISAARHDYLLAASPPMFSQEYFSQFRIELWQASFQNLGELSWSDSWFLARQGRILAVQSFIFFIVIFFILRNREALNESKQWKFLSARPFSAGLFITILIQFFFPKSLEFSSRLLLIYRIAGGVSFIRLLGLLLQRSWKTQAAYAVTILYIVSSIMKTVSLPLPLYRLYILLVSLLTIYFLWRWAARSVRQKDVPLYALLLRIGILLPCIIVIAQLLGQVGLAAYLFESLLASLAMMIAILLLTYMMHGALHWVFFASPVWKIKQLRSEAESLARHTGFLADTAIVVFVLLPIILTTWNVYGSMVQAIKSLMALGFDIGSARISAGLIIATAGTLYGSFLLSRVIPKVLLDEMVAGDGMERGVRISVGRLIQYFIIFIGVIVALIALGLDLTKLTIILSALGVGIGFGLQGIVNNFVCGLILLFERPLRVGDTIELNGDWAIIKEIGLRATTVQALDQADLIIPNADLVNNQLTNWTLSNRQGRIKLPVGVAYGSDVPRVIEILLACAGEHGMVAKSPPPQVLFLRFGESSLDFELRAWVNDVDYRLQVISELHQGIDRRFREASIEIAFPQRDLHLRSIDKSITVPSLQTP